jgi:hypothetical protein
VVLASPPGESDRNWEAAAALNSLAVRILSVEEMEEEEEIEEEEGGRGEGGAWRGGDTPSAPPTFALKAVRRERASSAWPGFKWDGGG